ncbi:hypothetical protein PILCRDRAFT_4493 [Piloderma croceum F 1598]|uniref:Uncharacterized protein n=1 Tax=Piloderma croceum (strain F 1598) TaxID=765440 RepID=A0A0C3G7B5_PILCF|nr:hypothetical protein PILCRDRAFT_4493 [Piloderma croceum F 1598]
MLGLERNLRLPRHVLHKTSSTNILIGIGENGEAEENGESLLVPESASMPPAVVGFKDTSREVDEDEYGEIIKHHDSASKYCWSSTWMDPRLHLQPLLIALCPDILDAQLLTVLYTLWPKGSADHHLRGDSISSMGPDGSINPQLSWSSMTATSIGPARYHGSSSILYLKERRSPGFTTTNVGHTSVSHPYGQQYLLYLVSHADQIVGSMCSAIYPGDRGQGRY